MMAVMLDINNTNNNNNNNSCDGFLLSLDSHKSVPAPFLTKTYQLVDDVSTDHIVSWGEDDSTFVVWRPPEFARDLLPNYFKHNNFSSFVRQLNTYGFRKIVPDRWEFANDFFKRGEKHLLCEIHRRKTAQPQVSINHYNNNNNPHSPLVGCGGGGSGSFFSYPNRHSNSPTDSDELQQLNWYGGGGGGGDSSPLSSPRGGNYNYNYTTTTGVCFGSGGGGGNGYNNYISSNNNNNGNNNTSSSPLTALSEDNERLRRSNTLLMSELAHMRKLYNDIIYFVQNHVKPVAPSNASYPLLQQQNQFHSRTQQLEEPKITSSTGSAATSTKMKLFGVPLLSKKRLHPDHHHHHHHQNMDTTIMNKSRLVLDKNDLGLNLMPPSPC